ncbi:MAG: Rieske (2Fe-2S) protein [Chloroflexi bacterium]|nr:Rieske (2Fe-2S) protein [Chloroflexota bacterium]MCH8350162.1 Rieske (2Fe-2S) protein [Chloroflexota bacterium]MCI0780612.1 Rieske (2Fe-2S) protein [Chloroflexota bacterium]MCI0787810.1 Rieske (2Fe-2S) protein [Chloroflexota bacterium]MCI0795144.1 Rieske (2Fe-2S) protein [Chloroflexota bacterium]
MDLGPESSFTKFPSVVHMGDWSFFLVQGKEGYKLLSTVCPHAGGEVVDWGTSFMCPDHGWRFEMKDGVCVNGPLAQMTSFPVTVQDGHLFADVPIETFR